MGYNYKKASDLVAWCKEEIKQPNAYRLGGIGRYEKGIRIFDCIGLIKCFMWHDYSEKNAAYYNKEVPDFNETGFFMRAIKKGSIETIPEIEGLMVYQKGHIGVYIGNGEVIEATASFDHKIVMTYFKGAHPHTDKRRTTWTHWFMMNYLDYDQKGSDEIVNEVIDGIWGNGAIRIERLKNAGYDAAVIQKMVNEKLTGAYSTIIKLGDYVTPKSRYDVNGTFLIDEVMKKAYPVIEMKADRVLLGNGLNTWFKKDNVRK